jgi:hypothetical protein
MDIPFASVGDWRDWRDRFTIKNMHALNPISDSIDGTLIVSDAAIKAIGLADKVIHAWVIRVRRVRQRVRIILIRLHPEYI